MTNKVSAKDEKAAQILGAARRILARHGYAATTINRVAAEAGVSRGLLHYYFKNKEDLLATVIQANLGIAVELVAGIFSRCESAATLSGELTDALRTIVSNDPELFDLLLEGWSVSRHSAAVDQKLKDFYSNFRDAILAGLEEAVGRRAIRPTLSLDGLAAMITAIIDGLGLQVLTEPELIGSDGMWETVRRGLEVLLDDPCREF